MGLVNLLSMAGSALTTHQAAIETASHNIASASTEGYTRQRAVPQAFTPQRSRSGRGAGASPSTGCSGSVISFSMCGIAGSVASSSVTPR